MKIKNNPGTLGMANAVAGVEGGEAEAEINPASMIGALGKSVSVNYTGYPEGIGFQQALMSYRLSKNTVLGMNLNAFQSGDIDSVDNQGNIVGVKYNDSTVAFGVTLAKRFEELEKYRITGVGVTARIISEKIESETSMNFLSDFGLMFRIENNDKSRFGIAVRNIGTKPKFINEEDTPVTLAYGISRWFMSEERLLIGLSAESGPGSRSFYAGGGEYRIDIGQQMWGVIRAGYTTERKDLGPEAGITAGMGIMWENMGINLVWRPSTLIGDTQAMELKYQFSPKMGARVNRYAKIEFLEALDKDRQDISQENRIRYELRAKDAVEERDKAIFTQGVTEPEVKEIDAYKNMAEDAAKKGVYDSALGFMNQAYMKYKAVYIKVEAKRMLEELKNEEQQVKISQEELDKLKAEAEAGKAKEMAWALYQDGLQNYLRGDIKKAIDSFEKYLATGDGKYKSKTRKYCSDAYSRSGYDTFAAGEDLKEASRMWRRGIELDSDNSAIKTYMDEYVDIRCNDLFNKGVIEYSNGKIDSAQNYWEECRSLNPKYAPAVKALKRVKRDKSN
ncbi:MAG: hypothetical protein ABII64_00585 [Elusimicrobiota bacterium]